MKSKFKIGNIIRFRLSTRYDAMIGEVASECKNCFYTINVLKQVFVVHMADVEAKASQEEARKFIAESLKKELNEI